jgi:hypothetical protein
MAADRSHPPDEVVDRVRSICARLPDAQEHDAWTGTSWRLGSTTFAHVVQIADGRPPAYATAFATEGPATVITFQVPPEDRDALRATGHPYHLPSWRPGIAGVVIEGTTDWSELGERIEDSYRECGGRLHG